MSLEKIKISIIDDHPVVLKGLRTIISNASDMELFGEYQSGEDLLKGFIDKLPDVLILDIKIPGIGGEEIAQQVSKKYPNVRMIALTYLDSIYFTKLMMRNGVLGYILKTCSDTELIAGIRTVAAGEQYLQESIKEKVLQQALLNKKEASSIPALTRREKEVLQLIATNCNSRQIAEKLFLSKRTVENHRANMLLKLNVKNSASLIRKAIELNLLN